MEQDFIYVGEYVSLLSNYKGHKKGGIYRVVNDFDYDNFVGITENVVIVLDEYYIKTNSYNATMGEHWFVCPIRLLKKVPPKQLRLFD